MKPQIPDILRRSRRCVETGNYRETCHAQDQARDRGIPLPDSLYALRRGRRNTEHDEYDYVFDAWNYAIDGKTPDGLAVRIVISFDDPVTMLIITIIDLT